MRSFVLKALVPVSGVLFSFSAGSAWAADGKETQCDDGKDDDGDTVYDCGDNDCHDFPACIPDGSDEVGEGRCGDFIDNDKDGHVDCDDNGCVGTKVCSGSWDLQVGGNVGGTDSGVDDDALPDLAPGKTVEDLIGKGDDKDGERSDEVCADGIDNDNDGRTDCADFGCRFDAQVSVCRENPGIRFSIVSHITQSFESKKTRGST